MEFVADDVTLPHRRLASLPAPVDQLPDLGDAVGVGDRYAKRDGRTGDRYGGNEVRKLEFLLADAIADGCGRPGTATRRRPRPPPRPGRDGKAFATMAEGLETAAETSSSGRRPIACRSQTAWRRGRRRHCRPSTDGSS
jgi:hypothetical protein